MAENNDILISQPVIAKPCCTYIVAWQQRGPCKIGIAIDVRARAAGLQHGNPYLLKPVYAWRFKLPETAYECEQKSLLALRAVRLQGEWVEATVRQCHAVVEHYASGLNGKRIILPWPFHTAAFLRPDTKRESKRRQDAVSEHRYLTK